MRPPLWWALLLCLLPGLGFAKGQLQAGPILLQMAPGQKATRLNLSNSGDANVAAQVRVYAWSQVNGADQLTPSDAIVASPPIVELVPGAEQLVRLVRLGGEAVDRDQTFRLVVDELPQPGSGSQSVVAVRLRYLLPLFVRADGAGEAKLTCQLGMTTATLECRNSGGRAAKLGATWLVDASGNEWELGAGLYGYVLPGSRRVWALPEDSTGFASRAVQLKTRLNGQPETLPLQN